MGSMARRGGKSGELKSILEARLKSGAYKPGEQLPTEPHLVEEYGYSKCIVREAVGLLVNEGYLVRIQGKGTFVSERKPAPLTIALVIPEFTVAHKSLAAPLAVAVEAEARRHGARTLLFVYDWTPESERAALADAVDRRVDGAVVFTSAPGSEDALRRMQDAGIPLVLVDRYIEGADFSHVVTDNFKGAYDVVNTIAGLGVTDIHFLSLAANLTSVNDRVLGYTQAVNDLGLPCNVTLVSGPDGSAVTRGTGAYDCVRRSLEGAGLPMALFMMNASLIPVACAALDDLEVPLDQRLFAYFDSPVTDDGRDICYIQVEQQEDEIGRRAVQTLVERMRGRLATTRIAVEPTITIYNHSVFRGHG